MRIMVYDVAADSAGSISILRMFHKRFMKQNNDGNTYYFVTSVVELTESDNIRCIRLPWVKKSYLHRLYCDYVTIPRLVKKLKIDHLLSLQNLLVPRLNIPQSTYLHNSIPFTSQVFSILKDRTLWIKQHIISWLIVKSIKNSDQVIVQTQWMKDECLSRIPGISPDKIKVEPVDIDLSKVKPFVESPENLRCFFYPATPYLYKNHRVIVEACQLLKQKGIADYKVIFTIDGTENREVAELRTIVANEQLPISFAGNMSQEEVYSHYTQSVLIFPSKLESLGIPMLEAVAAGCPILASDWEVPREVLSGYSKVEFFRSNDPKQLEKLMENLIFPNNRVEK